MQQQFWGKGSKCTGRSEKEASCKALNWVVAMNGFGTDDRQLMSVQNGSRGGGWPSPGHWLCAIIKLFP